ncbi:MAG: hypothetical protein JZU52_11745, partial [Lamprocystis purpurea]|nr:hypothetical protein [Lamprocystis purpurea]
PPPGGFSVQGVADTARGSVFQVQVQRACGSRTGAGQRGLAHLAWAEQCNGRELAEAAFQEGLDLAGDHGCNCGVACRICNPVCRAATLWERRPAAMGLGVSPQFKVTAAPHRGGTPLPREQASSGVADVRSMAVAVRLGAAR